MKTSKYSWWRSIITTMIATTLIGTSVPPLVTAQEAPEVEIATDADTDLAPEDEVALSPETEIETDADPDAAVAEEAAIEAGEEVAEVRLDPQAADVRIQVDLISDGTADFNADDSAGNDSSANNGIVRVNDTVTYRVEIGSEQAAVTDLGFELTLPKGMEIVALPGQCLAGSSITPPSIGEASLPLNDDSYQELAAQTLICKVADSQASLQKIDVVAKVSNLIHHGQDLQVTKAVATIADAEVLEVPEAELPTVTASSRLQWDINKIGIGTTKDSGYTYGPMLEPCPWDTRRLCQNVTYSLVLSGPAGGKGAMPAVGDINFVEDLSPEGLYGLSGAELDKFNANLDKYGSRIYPSSNDYELPGSKIGVRGASSGVMYTEKNSVRDSGTILVEGQAFDGAALNAAGEYGKKLNLTISGADMTLKTYPTESVRPTGTTAGPRAMAVARRIAVYTPLEAITEFGIKDGNTWVLRSTNWYRDLEITGFNGATENSDQQPDFNATEDGKANDYRTRDMKVELGQGFTKNFTGVPGQPSNMTPNEFNPGWAARGEGPPGGATLNSGNITVAPTQNVLSQLMLTGANPGFPATNSSIMCDAWDKTKLNLHAQDVPASTYNAGFQAIGSGGQAVWVSGYNNVAQGTSSRWARSATEVPVIKVQYSAVSGGNGAASECGEATGPWFDNPADLPGNDPALAAQGIYTDVGRVRVFVVLPAPVANSADLGSGVRMAVSINLRVAEYAGIQTGDILPNYAGYKTVVNEKLELEQVLAHASNWNRSSYNPTRHSGYYGDRLKVELVRVRIDKKVRKENVGDYSDTPPVVRGDGATPDRLQFRIAPTITSGASTPGIYKDVWVEDCLPANLVYDTASLDPAVISDTTPSDAKLAEQCKAGETYLRWVIEDHEVNRTIEPIIVTAEVRADAISGNYTNAAVVWGEGDESAIKDRTDTTPYQIANQNRIGLSKRALNETVQVNRTDQDTFEENSWRVSFFNTVPSAGGTPYVNPVVIDVLPRAGVGANAFTGTIELKEVSVRRGDKGTDNVQVLYTSATNPQQDPRHVSNQPGGSTAWCDKPEGGQLVSGTGNCPNSLAEVTAVRVQRAGEFTTGDGIEFDVTMVGKGNTAGDVYDNLAGAYVDNYHNMVQSSATEKVVSSAIGDTAWLDRNANGLQDADEPGLPNITVKLVGEDDLGNKVELETTTDAQGKYWFRDLRAAGPDGYVVTFSKPDGLNFTTQTVPGDVTSDSDPAVDTGVTAPILLARNSTLDTIDAGYVGTSGFKIKKIVTGPGAEFAGSDQFSFSYVCRRGQQEVARSATDVVITLEDGKTEAESEAITGIPTGVECEVTETTFGRSDTDAQTAPVVTVNIDLDPNNLNAALPVVELQNRYSAAQIMVKKVITGEEQARLDAMNQTFTVQVTCQQATGELIFEKEVSITGQDTVPVPGLLPVGAKCFAVETNNGGAIAVTIDHSQTDPLVVEKADTLQQLPITVSNEFERQRSPYYIHKTVVPAGFAAPATFDVEYQCQEAGRKDDGSEVPATGWISVPTNSQVLLGHFPPGADCKVIGENRDTANVVGYNLAVQLNPNAPAQEPDGSYHIPVTNTYTRKMGSLTLRKQISGNAAALAENQRFSFNFECTGEDGNPIVVSPVEITGAGETTIDNLPTGRCRITETTAALEHASLETTMTVAGATPTPGATVEVDITDGQLVELTANNHYTRNLGGFSVSKNNTGDSPTGELATKSVEVQWTCTLPEGGTKNGSLTLIPGGTPVQVTDIPTGAQCQLSEPAITADGYTITPSFDVNGFTINQTGAQLDVVLTNHYLRNTGGLTIAKQVGGATALAPAQFTFTYRCVDSAGTETVSGEVTVNTGESKEVTGIPTGTCTVTEQTNDPAHTDRVTTMTINGGNPTTGTEVEVPVTKDTTVQVGFTNTYTPHTGTFKLLKQVDKDQPSPVFDNKTYSFDYVCQPAYAGASAPQGVLSVKDGETVQGPEVPIGTSCTITEQEDSAKVTGYTETLPKPIEVTVTAEEQTFTAVNKYQRQIGGFQLAKKVTGSGAHLAAGKEFTFRYTCTGVDGLTYGPKDITVTGNEQVTVTDIPTGSCEIVEVDPQLPQTDLVTTFKVNDKEVAAGEAVRFDVATNAPVTIETTNEYQRHTAGFSVVKNLTGDNGGFAQEYEVEYTCTLESEGVVKLGVLKLTPGKAEEITGLPTGTKCVLSEVAHQVPDYTVTAQFDQPQFEIGAKDELQQVTLTNHYTRHRGGFVVAKKVAGDAVALAPTEFVFDYVCTDRTGAQVATGELVVPAGESRAVTDVPTSTCQITERDAEVPNATLEVDEKTVEVQVTTNATTSVEVTNTYTAKTGSFQLRKQVVANRTVEPKEFRFSYTCSPAYLGAVAPTGTLTVPGDGTVVSGPQLPIGTKCEISELIDSAVIEGFDHEAPAAQTVTVGDEPITLEFVNTYTARVGTFSITKKVTGSILAKAKTFRFHYTCTDGTEGVLEVRGNGNAVVAETAEIAVGARCEVREDEESAQHFGSILISPESQEFTIEEKGQVVPLEFENRYLPILPFIPPLIGLIPGDPGSSDDPTPPASTPTATPTVGTTPSPNAKPTPGAKGSGSLARTGVSERLLLVFACGIFLVVSGVVLIRRRRD